MKKFNEFIEQKQVENQIKECANILCEMDLNPEEFVNYLLENTDLAEDWKSWLSGIGSRIAGSSVGRWGQAAGQVGKSVVHGGLQAGFKQARDTVAGPAVKFQKAEGVLKDLVQFLNSNQETKVMKSAGDPSKSIGEYLAGVLELLQKEKANMPKMQSPEVKQNYAAQDGGASVNAAEKAAAAQQPQGGPSRMDARTRSMMGTSESTKLESREVKNAPQGKRNAECSRCGAKDKAKMYDINAGKAKCKNCGGYLNLVN